MNQIKKAAFTACSNGLRESDNVVVEQLQKMLESVGIQIERSPYLFEKDREIIGNGKKRAKVLNRFFQEKEMDAIFDLSGGDLANEVLPWLDYDAIKESSAVFWGYSDLSTVINAIASQTGKASVLYQMKNLIWDSTEEQFHRFQNFLKEEKKVRQDPGQKTAFVETELFQPHWEILQGEGDAEELLRSKNLAGGNVRCFLKLAGTRYFPSFDHKVLFLESLGGRVPQISTYFAQLSQAGAFAQADALLLGTFTELEKENNHSFVYELLKPYLPEKLFVAKTGEVGHDKMSKALRIGG